MGQNKIGYSLEWAAQVPGSTQALPSAPAGSVSSLLRLFWEFELELCSVVVSRTKALWDP